MKDVELRFTGSVPAAYDRLMVPLIFQPYADELAERVRGFAPKRILETAAGTGALTRALAAAVPDADIVATDLNPPMLEMAAQRVASRTVSFRQADAQELPFDDDSFDLVVCQFGAMFFPNRVLGHSQAHRVLVGGGRYLLAIWDRIERNPLTEVVQQALVETFPDDPPLFMREGPFSYHDPSRIESDLHDAGFGTVEIETVEKRSRCSSARCGERTVLRHSDGPRDRRPRPPQRRARVRGGGAGLPSVRRRERHRRGDIGARGDGD